MALHALGLILLSQTPAMVGVRNDLTLADLYPDKSYSGKTAVGTAYSYDNRYIAYLWNGYDEKGNDIYLFDTQTKKTIKLTSVDMFAPFDYETKNIADRYKREKEEKERKQKEEEEKKKNGGTTTADQKSGGSEKKEGGNPLFETPNLAEQLSNLSEEEQNEFTELFYQEPSTDSQDGMFFQPQGQRGPGRFGGGDYVGPSSFEWANTSNTMLITYKGEVYKLKIGDTVPEKLTKTVEPETNVKFTSDDSGFIARRGNAVYRVKFGSSYVEQLNPTLPNNLTMNWYSVSPDGSKMVMAATRSTGKDREVAYIVYRGRFAEARTVNRGVADDDFKSESYLYMVDLTEFSEKTPNDGRAWEIYKWPQSKEYGQTSLAPNPWSQDGSKFTFATWKRDKKELQVLVADGKTKKTEVVYTDNINGGHTIPGRARPQFTPDGKIILCHDKSGFIQLWKVDPEKKTSEQLTKGDFEIEPISMSKDGKWMLVTADAKNPAYVGLYKASLSDGTLSPIVEGEGVVGSAAISSKGDTVAYTYRSWSALSELYFKGTDGKETQLTNSHNSEGFWKTQKIKPTLFSYKNRHGQTVRGYMYLPPDYKKGDKRPLWMYTYGGPLSSRGKDVLAGNFNQFNMYMAYKYGYITCTIDPRGMSGYGGAWESANWESPGKAQVEDLSDAVKWFIENYNVDPKKVGINGWSFGGFQTQMCMYTAPDVFTLGIAGAGPTEWQNYNTWYTGGVIGFSRLGNPNDLDKYSLTKLAKNLKSPLMLLHGMEDTNVLYQDTVKVYRSLLQANKGPLVELVVDPTGGHGLGGDIPTKARYTIYEGFLARYWGPYKKK